MGEITYVYFLLDFPAIIYFTSITVAIVENGIFVVNVDTALPCGVVLIFGAALIVYINNILKEKLVDQL
ncbi:MAG: hypothetical protein GY705_24835 [Bacteroidetes bacterium]|nr:hypothetical protein [Bacteroidota bacterium]